MGVELAVQAWNRRVAKGRVKGYRPSKNYSSIRSKAT